MSTVFVKWATNGLISYGMGSYNKNLPRALLIHVSSTKKCDLYCLLNDCLLFSSSDHVLDTLIASLQTGFKLTHEWNVSTYLGIDIKRWTDGSLKLVQSCLTLKIITETGHESNSSQH